MAENPIKEGVNAGILGIPPAVISMRVSNDCRWEKTTYESVKRNESEVNKYTQQAGGTPGEEHYTEERQEEGEEIEI